MKEPTQRYAFTVNLCHLSGDFSEAKTWGQNTESEKRVEIFWGRLNTFSKADVISAKTHTHTHTLITGGKSSTTYTSMDVNVLSASGKCPTYVGWKLS